jgi:hypothetical protein
VGATGHHVTRCYSSKFLVYRLPHWPGSPFAAFRWARTVPGRTSPP